MNPSDLNVVTNSEVGSTSRTNITDFVIWKIKICHFFRILTSYVIWKNNIYDIFHITKFAIWKTNICDIFHIASSVIWKSNMSYIFTLFLLNLYIDGKGVEPFT